MALVGEATHSRTPGRTLSSPGRKEATSAAVATDVVYTTFSTRSTYISKAVAAPGPPNPESMKEECDMHSPIWAPKADTPHTSACSADPGLGCWGGWLRFHLI